MSYRINKLIENIKKMLNRKDKYIKRLFHINCMSIPYKDVGRDK